MVLYRRNRVAGGTYFFTVTLRDRRSDVLLQQVGLLREAFRWVRTKRPFTIDAIVILPDHLHTILTLPEDDADYSGRWRSIKSRSSQHFNKAGLPLKRDHRGKYQLWQRRIWEHTLRNDNDFNRHVDYIRWNPVKHGLAGQANNWSYSSLHRYIRLGLLPDSWNNNLTEDQNDYGE